MYVVEFLSGEKVEVPEVNIGTLFKLRSEFKTELMLGLVVIKHRVGNTILKVYDK